LGLHHDPHSRRRAQTSRRKDTLSKAVTELFIAWANIENRMALSVKGGSFVTNFGQVVKATYVVERLSRDLRFDPNDLQPLRKDFPE
jgi:hypothetical protein